VNCPIRALTGVLLLSLCGGCANRYFAWNQPLPIDQDHGFVQTDPGYGYGYSDPGWLTPPSDHDGRAMKDFCRELGKQNLPCPVPTRFR
jgi:hypothetical protein